MGVVIQCEDLHEARTVALKSFRPELLTRSFSRKRFLQEASNWILLGSHPNIVRAHQLEIIGSPPQPYLVLEWVTGHIPDHDAALSTLLRERKRRPLPFKKSLRIALGIVQGMKYAAKQIPGFVHRDLKPANILIDEEWQVKVTDFGIAQSVAPNNTGQSNLALSDNSKNSLFIGTPGYAAPELANYCGPVDQRADIFSFGCVLYEMLTGTRLIPGSSLEAVVTSNRAGETREIPDALPECIRNLIISSTRKDVEMRYSDWGDLEQAISSCYMELSGHTPPFIAEEEKNIDQGNVGNGRSYLLIGRSYLSLGFYAEAIDSFNMAMKQAENVNDRLLQSEILHSMGAVHLNSGNLAAAESSLLDALSIAQEMGDMPTEVDALSTLGSLYATQSSYTLSFQHLNSALEKARQLESTEAEMVVLGNLASTYGRSGDPEKAIEKFLDLLQKCIETEDEVLHSRTLASLGVAYYDAGNYSKAIENLNLAQDIYLHHGDDPGRLHVLEHLWMASRASGQLEDADSYRQKYEQLASHIGKSS